MVSKLEMYIGMVKAQLSSLPATKVEVWFETMLNFVQLGTIVWIAVIHEMWLSVGLLLAIFVSMVIYAGFTGKWKN